MSFLELAGGAVSNIFGAVGAGAEASAYKQAASLATENAGYAAEAAQIQETQAQRQITQTIGAQKAGYGGAGLAESGSALSVLKSSQQQGNLQMQVIHTQGLINENAYKEQAAADIGMEGAAKAQQTGGILGGILSGAAALLSL